MNDIYSIEVPQKSISLSKNQFVGEEIINFGQDNKYPNTMLSLIEESQTAVAVSNVYAKYIASSFKDENIGKTIVSKTISGKNVTLNQFCKQAAQQIARYNGVYILVVKNLSGETTSASILDFPQVRFSAFDDLGRSNYAYVGDWASTIKKSKNTKKHFFKYPLFNNNFDVYKKMAESTGTTASVYHIFLDEQYYYPASPFQSVIHDMATEHEIQLNRYEEITQGSPAKLIIRTDIAGSDQEQEEQIEEIETFMGSKGRRALIIQTQFDEQGQPITNGYAMDTIPDTRDLSQFESAEKACANNIRKCIGIPSILIDFENVTSINVSGEQMKMSVKYFDEICEPIREQLSESFGEIFAKTSIPFSSKDFTLKNKTFDE